MQHYQTPAPASSNVAPKMPEEQPVTPPSAAARAAEHARRLVLLERALEQINALERSLEDLRAGLAGTLSILDSRPTPRTDRSRSRSRRRSR